MTRIIILLSALLLSTAINAEEAPSSGDQLFILNTQDSLSYVVGEGEDAVTITRKMTDCAKNKGFLQALIPVDGVNPVTEIEILAAANDANAVLVDMRTEEWFANATIPGSINIPYTEVAMRLDELGCEKQGGKLDCSQAKDVYGYCNGPVCAQSPIAMRAMVREGFPANKIYYYRGGMLDWDALGLTTVEGDF